jgi:membrane protein
MPLDPAASKQLGSSASPAKGRVSASPPTAVQFLLAPWQRIISTRGVPTLRYLMKSEVHTFASSVAANAILSFFPFILLLMWLVRNVFHSQAMFNAVVQLLRDHLPVGQDFVVRNLDSMVKSRQRAKLASVVILLITSTGVFLPLEVALNRVWGFAKNRSYIGNQLVSLALAFACGILAMVSVGLAAGNQLMLEFMMIGHTENIFTKAAAFVVLKVLALITSIAIFFLIYWWLPHGKVPAGTVLPAAMAMGVLWEVSKYAYMKALPWLNFPEVYGPFSISVTLMFWAFLSGLMLLAGAHLALEFSPQPLATESSHEETDDLI